MGSCSVLALLPPSPHRHHPGVVTEESDLPACPRHTRHQCGISSSGTRGGGWREQVKHPYKLAPRRAEDCSQSELSREHEELPSDSCQLTVLVPAPGLSSVHKSFPSAGHPTLLGNIMVVLDSSSEFTAHQITLLCATTGESEQQS